MEEVPMSNLKIKDIETLERLSFDEMEQVVGGSVCPESVDVAAKINGLNNSSTTDILNGTFQLPENGGNPAGTTFGESFTEEGLAFDVAS